MTNAKLYLKQSCVWVGSSRRHQRLALRLERLLFPHSLESI